MKGTRTNQSDPNISLSFLLVYKHVIYLINRIKYNPQEVTDSKVMQLARLNLASPFSARNTGNTIYASPLKPI